MAAHGVPLCCAQLVANAGDSRAVLCRGGKAVTLSTDHKPATPAERARILDAGGAVCHEGRLNGELTVARSIGAIPGFCPY
jgi:serine/threonine protein phosphatase PrpC